MFSVFRIKAAQKHELYDPSLEVSRLSKVTVHAVWNIWMHRLIAKVCFMIRSHNKI